MDISQINHLKESEATDEFYRCCSSARWAAKMARHMPFESRGQLYQIAEEIWQGLSGEDWLEAFSHHPRGTDIESMRAKLSRSWARSGQSGAACLSQELLSELAEASLKYESRFGYPFVVCATGRTGEDVLGLLKGRLANDPESELRTAVREQSLITRVRLERLCQRAPSLGRR